MTQKESNISLKKSLKGTAVERLHATSCSNSIDNWQVIRMRKEIQDSSRREGWHKRYLGSWSIHGHNITPSIQ